MNIITIYYNPVDHPGQYVARLFNCEHPTNEFIATTDLQSARQWMREKFLSLGSTYPFLFTRSPGDEPHILESWI